MPRPPAGAAHLGGQISVARFKSGKITEEWTQWDALGLFRQLGVSTTLQQPASDARGTETRPHA